MYYDWIWHSGFWKITKYELTPKLTTWNGKLLKYVDSHFFSCYVNILRLWRYDCKEQGFLFYGGFRSNHKRRFSFKKKLPLNWLPSHRTEMKSIKSILNFILIRYYWAYALKLHPATVYYYLCYHKIPSQIIRLLFIPPKQYHSEILLKQYLQFGEKVCAVYWGANEIFRTGRQDYYMRPSFMYISQVGCTLVRSLYNTYKWWIFDIW